MLMKTRLTIISMILLCSMIVACEPKYPGPEMTSQGVSFSYYAPKAKSVAIAGSFNAWDIHKDILSGPDKKGMWSIVIPLHQGRYEYLYVLNKKVWHPDPSVPEVDDGFGGKNSVLLIRE
jgi:1,4-alpha-glucan branching enzyme